ncbi:MAG: glycoside hydrolase family 2 protein [Bacteroidetes bacterium]|nr:glycoside hydrolase family 2 protein [Bacteroidota bacterium]
MRLELGGDWQVVDATGSIAFVASFPGNLITALHHAGHIPDPYWGMNEYDLRWIADRSWTAVRAITLDAHQTDCSLIISQLDTVATIRVNGDLAFEAANAFRRYQIDLSNLLVVGENSFEICFKSPTAEANLRQERQPFFVPYTTNYPVPNGNMLRKPQCDFGWDWNAALMPSGIYGDLYLQTNQLPQIGDVLVHQEHRDNYVVVHVVVDVVADITGSNGTVTASLCGQNMRSQINDARAHFRFEIKDPELWWTVGQGSQMLHDLEISAGVQSKTQKIGLRTIRLCSEPDEVGRSFMFEVNGRPIFAKGANWIPADALASPVSVAGIRGLLQSAVDANMNMIRVWGGGWYESDAFYDICDELGILIWQDAMFSCSLYPADDAFLAEVTREITDNAKRLQHRASLAIWCGDNELIGALTWYEESRADRDRYLVAYDRLNRTIEAALKAVDPQVNWWPSSPSPGPLSFGDAWHDDSAGDMHFWSVWHEGRDFEHYRDVAPRFCSEFGFQSYPSMDVIRSFAAPEDFNIAAPVMESHQKNDGGNARIAETMFRYFRFPVSFEDFVYLSQVQQGLAIHTAVTYWRSLKPHCMGSLIWQLNDTWPVASWSSLDYGGGWKLLHHMARRFYAPVTVSTAPTKTGFQLTAVNDGVEEVLLKVRAEALACDGRLRLLGEVEIKVGIEAAVPVLEVSDLAADEVLVMRWPVNMSAKLGKNLAADMEYDHFAPIPYEMLPLEDPQIEISIARNVSSADQTGTFQIDLTAQKPAFFVAIEADCAGRFSDNGFLLIPGEERRISFTPDDETAKPVFKLRDLHSATYG